MKIVISYIGDQTRNAANEKTLFLSTSPSALNKKNHLYISKSHRPEKMFLLISQRLVFHLIENPQIKEIHLLDHFEILYYVIYYKNLLSLKTISFDQNEKCLFNREIFLSKKILEEAKKFIMDNLLAPPVSLISKRDFNLSIVLTTFNRSKELEETLKALEDQTFSEFELIVINDGSNDPDVLKKHEELRKRYFDKNLKWQWVNQDNTYLGQARNNGAEKATGNCLLFIDDDNIPAKDMVEIYKKHWEILPFDIFTSCFKIFKDGDPSVDYTWAPFPTPVFSQTLINIISDAQCLINKDLFFSLGRYTTDRSVGYEDWEFYLKALIQNIKIFPMVHNQYSYRIHADSNSMRSNTNDFKNISRGLRPLINQFPRLKNAFLINVALHSEQINKK